MLKWRTPRTMMKKPMSFVIWKVSPRPCLSCVRKKVHTPTIRSYSVTTVYAAEVYFIVSFEKALKAAAITM